MFLFGEPFAGGSELLVDTRDLGLKLFEFPRALLVLERLDQTPKINPEIGLETLNRIDSQKRLDRARKRLLVG